MKTFDEVREQGGPEVLEESSLLVEATARKSHSNRGVRRASGRTKQCDALTTLEH